MRGVAKGIAYMHCRPEPLVHRHLTSSAILVMRDGTGKIADCAKSRRVNTLSTSTATVRGNASALWSAPELTNGERYNETVDCFSFGIILVEVASQQLPYINAHKGDMKKVTLRMVNDIITGKLTVNDQIEHHWPDDFVEVGCSRFVVRPVCVSR